MNGTTPPEERLPRELELRFGQSTECGPARTLNEDYAYCFLPRDQVKRRSKGAVFLVADGMGGHQAGEVASRQAVEQVLREYLADTTHQPGESLVRAFKAANHALYSCAQSDPTKSGMGTTLVVAVILGRKVYLANVGDSRAYLINKKGITQITEDHSWVEEQVQARMLTRAQAERHPQRNVITRALGAKPAVEVDLFEGELHEGDALLLCTDGLCGPVSEEQMAHAIQGQPPSSAAAQLVALAGVQGGDDNATALIVEAVAPRPPAPPPSPEDTRPTETRASPAALSAIRDWLSSPGRWRIGERRQRLVVGLATLVFVFCLCAAVAVLSALSQKLTGDPVAAPFVAPIHDESWAGKDPAQFATYLGYTSIDEMTSAFTGPIDTQNLGMADLFPAQRGVFLVGPVRDWSCPDGACTFELPMADKNYRVSYNQQAYQNGSASLGGRWVRVFGHQPEEGETVEAQFIERGSRWWAWWDKAWKMVYQIQPWDREVWVYGIVDKSPNGLLEVDVIPDVRQGDQILMRGRWGMGKRSALFSGSQVYALKENRYIPLTRAPIPMPEPTVTLAPTGATSSGP